jgi:hypothetical protein
LLGSVSESMFMDTDFLALQRHTPLKDVFGRSQRAAEERSAGSSDEQSTVVDANEEWMEAECSSLSTVISEEAATELLSKASQLRQHQKIITRIEDLQAENALLRRQLKEAHDLTVPSLEASAEASFAVVEDLQMQNHHLLKTVQVLQEKIAILCQKQGSMEQVIQDNVDLQRKHQEMNGRMMLLIDDNDHLRNQLSAERERWADAQEQWCGKQELFHRMFMQVERDMDRSSGQHASVAMKDRGAPLSEHLRSTDEQQFFPLNKWNASASELFAEDKCKDDMTHAHGMKTSSLFLPAEGSFPSPTPRHHTSSQPILTRYLDARP